MLEGMIRDDEERKRTRIAGRGRYLICKNGSNGG